MCDFCSNIKNIEEYRKMDSWDREDNTIVKKLNGVHSLWSECEDCNYSGAIMDIAFCPICGRYLNENKDIKRLSEKDYKEIILFLLDELEWDHSGIKDYYLRDIENKYNIDF